MVMTSLFRKIDCLNLHLDHLDAALDFFGLCAVVVDPWQNHVWVAFIKGDSHRQKK